MVLKFRPVGFTSHGIALYYRSSTSTLYMARALVLEDYPCAGTVGAGGVGVVSRKKGARSMGEEKKEGENNNNNK